MGWLDLLTIPLSAGINYGMTSALNQQNAKLNHKYWSLQNKTLFEQNEQSADNAMQRSIDLYNQLQSPKAMVEQLKNAGLNPALMYSNSGMGGHTQTGPMGGAQGGQGAPTLGLQNFVDPLTMAQIQNLNADTKNKEEDSNLKSSQTQINNSIKKIKDLEISLKEKENEMSEITFGYKFQKIVAECTSAIEQANIDRTNGIINDATYMTQIETIQQNLANLKATYALLKANKNLTEQEINESLQRVNEMSANIWLLTSQAEIKEEELLQLVDNREWNYITKEDVKFVTSEVLDTFEEVYKAMSNGKQKQNLGIILKLLKTIVKSKK